MSINIRNINDLSNTETNPSSNDNLNNLIQIKKINKFNSNRRYYNSSNGLTIFGIMDDPTEDLENLKNIYSTQEREYNKLLNRYNQIIETLNQKRDMVDLQKKKYQSLRTNNNNMKSIILKLLKINGGKNL